MFIRMQIVETSQNLPSDCSHFGSHPCARTICCIASAGEMGNCNFVCASELLLCERSALNHTYEICGEIKVRTYTNGFVFQSLC